MTVRVRFAPSPTGYLHVGGARTALFNWLYARKNGGTFLLRIEDTDRARSSEEHTQVILDGLTWLGLDWDEEVTFQGAGLERHQALADRLLADGKAYLEDGAIRFALPPGEIAWDDEVHGRIAFQGADIPDFVLLRSDRTPTYNFAVVADDVDLRITHVMRGDDHISNTPKQIALYRALDEPLPVFAHVPMIHGTDGKKLSKRHGATAVGDYDTLGILPAALRNFLALLGWNPGSERELFFELDELVDAFSIDGVGGKSAIFDPTKLEWMNGEHLRHRAAHAPKTLVPLVSHIAPDLRPFADRVETILPIAAVRSRTVADLAAFLRGRVVPHQPTPDDRARAYLTKTRGWQATVRAAADFVEAIPDDRWTRPEALEVELMRFAKGLKRPLGEVFQPVRIALTGSTKSEPVQELVWAIGKDEARRRLRQAALESAGRR
jgi:glutamyl-tRNA synthetase